MHTCVGRSGCVVWVLVPVPACFPLFTLPSLPLLLLPPSSLPPCVLTAQARPPLPASMSAEARKALMVRIQDAGTEVVQVSACGRASVHVRLHVCASVRASLQGTRAGTSPESKVPAGGYGLGSGLW